MKIDALKLAKYMGLEELEPPEGAFTDLLGAYTGKVNFMAFENGQPNSMNVVLWNMVLSGFFCNIRRALRVALYRNGKSTDLCLCKRQWNGQQTEGCYTEARGKSREYFHGFS